MLRKLARTAAASLNPMAAMFGGVVGQEVRVLLTRCTQLLLAGLGEATLGAESCRRAAVSCVMCSLHAQPRLLLTGHEAEAVCWLGHVMVSLAVLPALPTLQVVKAASGKFHPLHQWFYFDSIESLPDEPLSAEEVAPEVRFFSVCCAVKLAHKLPFDAHAAPVRSFSGEPLSAAAGTATGRRLLLRLIHAR